MRRNVLLVCLDTLRADALAPWAEGAPLMPELSAEMARGVVFRNATATAPWTAPSVASILSGLLPSSHGVRELGSDLSLVPAVTTLAEVLGRYGWTPAACTGGGFVGPDRGMLQGFHRTMVPFSFGGAADLLLANPAQMPGAAPWFLFLHTYEAHDPYDAAPVRPGLPPRRPTPLDLASIDREAEADGGRSLVRRFLVEPQVRTPLFETARGAERMRIVMRWLEAGYRKDPEGPALVKEARAAYDRGLARLDRSLAGYLRDAEAQGLLRDTFVVIVADHGEGFGEHGTLHHGRRLYEELVHVPLSIRGPGLPEGKVVDGSVSAADILPTILDLAGLPVPKGVEGRSMREVIEGGPGRPVSSEERRTRFETGLPLDDDLLAVRDGRFTWIGTRDRKTGTRSEESFDRSLDPREETPLPEGDPAAWPPAFLEAVHEARERLRK